MVTSRPAVQISTAPMSLGALLAVADGAPVELSDDALDRIARSRRVVDDVIARGEAIYGVTTGVGHARDERLPPAALRQLQPMLLEMHVGALGPALPAARVRAALAARLNGIARGGAGVSPGVAQALAALLNHGIHPVIPAAGSVGAGDLGQLALVGRVLLGRGEVEVDGRRKPAATALADAGLRPVALEAKDALGLISANALSVAHGALLSRRLERLLAVTDLVVATSMEAVHANSSIVDPAVARVRGSRGQEAVCAGIRRALEGSRRTDFGGARSVQDALSFRVVPQVHGACRDLHTRTAAAVATELNAAADNPLVDLESGRLVSNGNFHPMELALTVEALRIALAHVGLLVERRMGHLWDALVTALGMPGTGPPQPPVGGGPPATLAGLGLRYPAAARYTRLRLLAQPVTLDVGVLDLGTEDHSTNAPEALAAAEESIGIVEELLVVELLLAVAGLGPGLDAEELGHGTRRLVGAVADELGRVPDGTMPDEVHRRISGLLRAWVDD